MRVRNPSRWPDDEEYKRTAPAAGHEERFVCLPTMRQRGANTPVPSAGGPSGAMQLGYALGTAQGMSNGMDG